MNFHKILFSLFLLLVSSGVSAQIYIQGTVEDRDTKKPIPDVIVQYGSSSQAFTYTDAKGRFRIPENSESVIHFQCFGYKSRSITKSVIVKEKKVVLDPSPMALKPVVISPDDADKLLYQAMTNTKKNLLVNHPISYLLHFLQDRTSDTLQNEIYMTYATTLDEKALKKNLKKERVPYTFNLVEIMRVQKTVTPTSDLFGAEYHASHLFTFGKSIDNETYRSFSPDSSQIVLTISPLKGRNGWAKGEVIIDGKDMTILSMEVESVDSILAKEPYRRYMGKQLKTLKKVGRFTFKKYGEKYFMSECFTYYKFKSVNEFGKEEEVSYYCDVDFRGFVEKDKLRKRRLSGFCQELYYLPNSTDKEFWLDDFDEELAMQYQGSGMAANSAPKKGNKLKKILTYTGFALTALGIAVLVK